MKRTNIVYLILLSVLLLALSSCDLFHPKPGPFSFHEADITNDEEYAVINAVIDTLCRDDDLVHISQHTFAVPDSDLLDINFYLDQIDMNDSLMRIDYLARNDSTHYLDPNRINDPATLFSADQFVYYFASSSSDMGFTGYYRDYPESSGIINLHRPGFKADNDIAIIEVLFMHNNLGAEALLLVLEKINDQWVLTWQFQMATS